MPNKSNHQQYGKISDDILLLSYNLIMRMNVVLCYNSEKNGLQSYHREVGYHNSNYNEYLINMKRSFDYYISIENIKSTESGTKEFIRIGANEILLLRNSLDSAYKWFNDKKFDNLYAVSNNVLKLEKSVDPIEISNLPMGKYIVLEPTVVKYNNGDLDTGVRMYLSSDSNYVDISLKNFSALLYTISNFNLFSAAQNMLNYIGRPEFGTNLYVMENNYGNNVIEEKLVAKTGRFIGDKPPDSKKSNKSYFNRLDTM